MESSVKRRVVLDFEVEGFHKWPDAVKQVHYLSYTHRPLFQIRIHIDVTHDDREVEIFIETDKIKNYLYSKYGSPCLFENMSCEMIALDILNAGCEKCYRKVEVYEDGRGGATVEL